MMFSLSSPASVRTKQRARTSVGLVVAVALAVLAGAAFWFYQHTTSPTAANRNAAVFTLSDSTQNLLKKLTSPVEIRFYAVLDPASTSPALRGLAGRIDGLLAAYEAAAPDKLRVIRYNSESAAAPDAASADGLKPFNLDKGDACYLGIAVECNGRKELLTQLAPEWESALEFDLSRAIERVSATQPVSAPTGTSAQTARAASEEVKRIIPNLDAVSLDEGRQKLREAALQELQAVVAEMETQVREAQQKLSAAQNGGSEAEQQAAMKHLQQLQLQQGEKLKQIGERTQAEITAFEQMKSAPAENR